MWNYLKQEWFYEMYEWSFEEPGPITWRMRLHSAKRIARRLLQNATCYVRGHNYEPDGCDFIDSGGEGFTCSRCGTSFTAWH